MFHHVQRVPFSGQSNIENLETGYHFAPSWLVYHGVLYNSSITIPGRKIKELFCKRSFMDAEIVAQANG
jgi:hypothetical protein